MIQLRQPSHLPSTGLILLMLSVNQASMANDLDLFSQLPTPDINLSNVPLVNSSSANSTSNAHNWHWQGEYQFRLDYAYQDQASEDPLGQSDRYNSWRHIRQRVWLEAEGEYQSSGRWHLGANAYYDAIESVTDIEWSTSTKNQYQQDIDIDEAWWSQAINNQWKIVFGRQISAWGSSELLRVLDFINPLDNRWPGSANAGDLRLPVTQAKLIWDTQHSRISAVLIPEHRFSEQPVASSEFGLGIALPEQQPQHYKQLGSALHWRYQGTGWQTELLWAKHWQDNRYLQTTSQSIHWKYPRSQRIAAAASATSGQWLMKVEYAYLDQSHETLQNAKLNVLDYQGHRHDLLLGVEYYGWRNSQISIEYVRRIRPQTPSILFTDPNIIDVNESPDHLADQSEWAISYNKEWGNGRWQGLLVWLGRRDPSGNSQIGRAELRYDLSDHLSVTGQWLIFTAQDTSPLSPWRHRDRWVGQVSYRF